MPLPPECCAFARLLVEPVVLVDGEGAVLFANEAFEALLDRRSAELRGALLSDLAFDGRQRVAQLLRFCSRTRSPNLGRLMLIRADGELTAFPYRGLLLRKKEPGSPGVIALTGERSAKLRALNTAHVQLNQRLRTQRSVSQELRRARNLLAVTLTSIGDAVIATDAAGAVTFVNPVASALTGWSEAEARGKPLEEVFEIVNQETREPVESPVTKVLKERRVVGLANHTVLISRDGTSRPIADSGAPIVGQAGELFGVVLVFRDQTEQHRRQATLQRRQKLEALGTLTAGIAHDFNNLLTVVSGHAGLLSMSTRSPSLDAISTAAQQAAELTTQLLMFCRESVVVHKPCKLDLVLCDALEFVGRVLGDDIGLHHHLGDELWLVEVDATQLQQALINLLVNARDAMPSGGAITVTSSNTSLCAARARKLGIAAGDYVTLAVRDTGCGISPEVEAKIFEPFFTTKPRGRGTGLGLSTVFGLVTERGGGVQVETEVGRGTCLRLYLPRYSGSAVDAAAAPSPSAKRTGSSEKILLVEDDPAVMDIMRQLLEDDGYEVVSALLPSEALRRWDEQQGRFDLLISDGVMPEMKGAELARRLRASAPGLPVLLVSGYSRDDEHALPLDDTTQFLAKPFRPEALLEQVRVLLQRAP